MRKLLVLLLLLTSSFAWWNPEWKYRMPINIDVHPDIALKTPSDYQIEITVDTKTLVEQYGMVYDCRDVRFTYLNGNNETEIPFTFFDCNTNRTLFVVKVPKLPAQVYMYWGNPNALPSRLTLFEVYDVYDDFEDGNTGGKTYWKHCAGSGSVITPRVKQLEDGYWFWFEGSAPYWSSVVGKIVVTNRPFYTNTSGYEFQTLFRRNAGGSIGLGFMYEYGTWCGDYRYACGISLSATKMSCFVGDSRVVKDITLEAGKTYIVGFKLLCYKDNFCTQKCYIKDESGNVLYEAHPDGDFINHDKLYLAVT
ncbi:MAG TPA: DUF2341 domain-containing protein, partial [Archaeoglobus sp.]|nr:DUF2341 domain-containing protein [Archaeoglobus sp.]